MRFSRTFLCATSAILLASAALAADPDILPPVQMDRINPGNSDASDVMSTHHEPAAANRNDPSAPIIIPVTPAPALAAPAQYQGKIPFGHAEAPAPIIPSGPHETIAVPVVNVQSLDAPEAAPATPVAGGADPAKEDPQEPTELTSPIFGESDTSGQPRKIVLRVLNKVTAQSQLLFMKPNDTVKMGHVEITAISCQTSSPTSQTDYAGLVDIVERSQTDNSVKPLFRGWMYASSPSITALEHPVYDVTMVDCQTPHIEPPKPEKTEEKPAKKGKK